MKLSENKALNLACISFVLCVGVAILKWSIIDHFSLFFFIPLSICFGIVWIVSFISSFVVLTKCKTIGKKAAMLPLSINIMTLVIILFVPLTKFWIKFDYWWYINEREKVIELIQSGVLSPNVNHNKSLIALPSSFPNISSGGNEVVVKEYNHNKYIFFYTFRGILDNYSGFLYVPKTGDPRQFSDLDEENVTELIKFDENWYYCSHH
jgi:hypothetical protein